MSHPTQTGTLSHTSKTPIFVANSDAQSSQYHFVDRDCGRNRCLNDKKPPGPKYKAWQERYKREIGKELRKKGFTPNEIEKILAEGADAIAELPKLGKVYKIILKQLKRIYDAWDAIAKARETVGDPPPYDQ